MYKYKGLISAICILLIFCTSSILADIKSTNGKIEFDTNDNGTSEALLNSSGLAIGSGLSPSTNLHVDGNAIITSSITVGGSNDSSDNLKIIGSMSFSNFTLSSNATLDANHTYYLLNGSSNLSFYLPSASAHDGKKLNLKNISTSGNVRITAETPIDTQGELSLGSFSGIKLIAYSGNWLIIGSQGDTEILSGLSSNLQAYYSFQEDLADFSLLDNDGAISGTTYATSVLPNGAIGQAFSFDGTDDMITVTDDSSIDLENTGTISFWIKPASDSVTPGSFSGWVDRGTSTVNLAIDNRLSQVDFTSAGNAFYFAGMIQNAAGDNDHFEYGSTDDSLQGLSWTEGSNPPGSPGVNEASSIVIETDGDTLYFIANNQNNADNYTSVASSDLDFTNFSGWNERNGPTGSAGGEPGFIDGVLVDQKIYLVAYFHSTETETMSIGSSNIDLSGNINWDSSVTFEGGARRNENSIPAIESDGQKLYYSFFATNDGASNFYTATSNLDGTGFSESGPKNAPVDDTNNRGSYIDMAIAGGKLHYALTLASAANNQIVVHTASSDLDGGNLSTWTDRGIVENNLVGAGSNYDAISINIETNGDNLILTSFSGNVSSTNIRTSSLEIDSTPVIHKEGAYSLHYTGGGFVFKWAGRPISFANLNINNYNHVTLTHDGNTLIFYINGQEVRRQTTTVDFTTSASNLLIGGDGSRFFEGNLDEIRIYDAALSAGDVLNLYQQR